MKRLVLVGAGHSHLFVLRQTRRLTAIGTDVTLLSPGKFWYSGMGPGMLSRLYQPSDDTIDVHAMVERNGGSYLAATVERIEPHSRQLFLSDGRCISYDVLSLNLGSEVPLTIPGTRAHAIPVKPIENLYRLRERLEANSQDIVIIGGGAAGCEISANLWHLLYSLGSRPRITLVHAGKLLFEQAPARASRILENYLRGLGVDLRLNSKVESVTVTTAELDDGSTIPFGCLLLAVGVRPPSLLQEAGLPCASDGSLQVTSTLQCINHPEIFAAGDCICFDGNCLPRVGVYAVRQGALLGRNLQAYLQGRPLSRFRPQKKFLLILNLGDTTGLFTWSNLALRGHWAFRLKDWLDRRFVSGFQTAE